MIDVFKTNVDHVRQAVLIIEMLISHFPGLKINFDLEDCDKVLRVKHNGILTSEIINLVSKYGFDCEEL